MENLISQLGLDETEGKVYLALLELGPATVDEITKKAGINRTLGYYALEKLGWYGLVDRATGKDQNDLHFRKSRTSGSTY
jgi:sugar-specific transcriptional regulator TrmB